MPAKRRRFEANQGRRSGFVAEDTCDKGLPNIDYLMTQCVRDRFQMKQTATARTFGVSLAAILIFMLTLNAMS
jgi:hypothetical protein